MKYMMKALLATLVYWVIPGAIVIYFESAWVLALTYFLSGLIYMPYMEWAMGEKE